MASFELFEQMSEEKCRLCAVPTSTCGHIRGILRGIEGKRSRDVQNFQKMICCSSLNNGPSGRTRKTRAQSKLFPFQTFIPFEEACFRGTLRWGEMK
jgi:threonine synthase